MSPELVGAFEKQWPDVAGRLNGLLASKNVPSWKRDDVVQETGLRLFRMWEKVDRNRPVWPLAVTIALNLMRDEARKRPEREVLGTVPEMPASHDVEDEGLARIELERVERAMAMLSPSHRDVLLNEINPAADVPKPARNATKMMRLRARRALATLLETAVVRAGLFGLKVRRSLGMNDPFLPLRLGVSESGVAPAAALALAALMFGTVTAQPPNVAHASELPKNSNTVPGSEIALTPAELTALSSSLDALTADMDALRARLAREARVNAKAKADRKAGDRDRDGKRGTNRKPGKKGWYAPPPPEGGGSPIEIPLPIGNGSIHVGGHIGIDAVGLEVGERNNGAPPACVGGVEPGSLGCGAAPPSSVKVDTGVEAEANGEKYGADVNHEVGTEVPETA